MPKTALITGATGQDGAYLAKLLIDRGYKVYGGVRRTSSSDYWRWRELGIDDKIEQIVLELAEDSNIIRTISRLKLDEVYNLAAQSYVATSFELPVYTSQIDAVAVCRLLEAIRESGRETKFYQASTSEMFGKVVETPQTEKTPFYPRSPYGVSKLYGHWITVNYREAYGTFACSGILFNHESPLRGPEFVTRKTVLGLSRLRHGAKEPLTLGNLEAQRDWGFAGDYVAGMVAILEADKPDDYVLATGTSWSVRDFVERAAAALDFDIEWNGEGADEFAVDRRTGTTLLKVDPRYYRPAEVDLMRGDSTKARTQLGWKPTVTFDGLVEMMVRAECDRLTR